MVTVTDWRLVMAVDQYMSLRAVRTPSQGH